MSSLCRTLWAIAFFVAGCSPPDPTVASHRSPLYVSSSHVWARPNIPVCWENPGAYDVERRWAEQAVTASWQAVSGVTFSGWGECKPDADGIRILIEDTAPMTIGIGNELDGRKPGMVLNLTFQNWSAAACRGRLATCIRNIAIHEFGHALGFAHEHHRPDTPDWCNAERVGDDGDAWVGDWDAASVMNYCNLNLQTTLSATDIAGAQAFYGPPATGFLIAEDIDIRWEPKAGGCAVSPARTGDRCSGWWALAIASLTFALRAPLERREQRRTGTRDVARTEGKHNVTR